MKRTKEQNIDLIKRFSDANGPSGFEDEVAKLGVEEAKDVCDCKIDHLRNTYLSLKKNDGKKVKVWLDAHSDEIGYIVQFIRPDGLLHFLPLGGIAPVTAPSTKVRIRNKEGQYVPAIIASKPPHFMSAAERNAAPGFENMFMDVGAVSDQDLKENFKIKIAAPVVPDVKCEYDEKNDIFIGKAFDCRIGCAALVETMNQLSDEDLDVDVIGTLTVQEEVGERGSHAAVQNIDAGVCICFEGCPADDTFNPEYMVQSGIKRGPMIRHFDVSMISSPTFMEYAAKIAEKYHIPLQESVRKGGGTNAKYIHMSRYGVPTIVIGIPVRYIHSSHGICSLEDYNNAINLAREIVKDLNSEIIDSL